MLRRSAKMRESDPTTLPDEVKKKIIIRKTATWGGLITTIGGVVFAIMHPDQAVLGMAVAMIGAGLVDPSKLLSIFTKV